MFLRFSDPQRFEPADNFTRAMGEVDRTYEVYTLRCGKEVYMAFVFLDRETVVLTPCYRNEPTLLFGDEAKVIRGFFEDCS